MNSHCTIVLSLLLVSLSAGSIARADNSLSPLLLQQTLAGTGLQTCVGVAPLRSVDLTSALMALYHANEHLTLWQDPLRLQALKSELSKLADDGLEPVDYEFAPYANTTDHTCTDLRISAAYLRALEHLSRGRLQQNNYEAVWHADGLPPVLLPAVTEIAVAGLQAGVAHAFNLARPSLPQYRALRAAYAAMDKGTPERSPVPPGPLLRPGMSDVRVGQVITQMQQEGFLQDTDLLSDRYDGALVLAVRRFQSNQGLETDGIVGPQTIRALNTSPAQRLQQVRLNLERLRWINAQRGEFLLLINVASGQIQLMRGNDLLWQARAQTGRPSRPTPAIVSYINRITLNPSWTVPPTILRDDILPQIRSNPDYLSTRSMQTLDTLGNVVDSQQINWSNPRGIVLRQPPGPTNPLGQVAFRLPNPYSIYLHDTPNQQLFQQMRRNVSSGCVRVEQADELARLLFAGLSTLQRERVADQLASGETHEVALSNGPQVILAYWTAYADVDGHLAFVPDSYNLDPVIAPEFALLLTPND